MKQIWCKKRGESPTGTLCTLGFEINMTPMYQVCESYMNKVDSQPNTEMNNDFNNSLRQEIQEGDKGDDITDTRETFLRWEKVFREVVEDEKKEIDFPQTAEEDLS